MTILEATFGLFHSFSLSNAAVNVNTSVRCLTKTQQAQKSAASEEKDQGPHPSSSVPEMTQQVRGGRGRGSQPGSPHHPLGRKAGGPVVRGRW